MKAARQVRVFGHVQGVFYRQWTVNQARRLGIAGWVRNCPDGTVQAHLRGHEDALARMIEAMREGPSQARVENVAVDTVEPEDASGFSVKF